MGAGGRGGGGVGGGDGRGALLGGASTASGPGEPSACGPRFSQGGYPFEAKKKGSEKGLWVWGEDLEGGACSDNLYTSGPRPRRIRKSFKPHCLDFSWTCWGVQGLGGAPHQYIHQPHSRR